MLRGLLSLLVAVPLVAAVAAPAAAQSSATLSISAPADAVEGDSSTTEKFFSIALSQAVSGNTTVRVCVTGTATIDTTAVETIPDTADYQFIASYLGAAASRLNSNCVNDIINSGDTELGVIVPGIRVKGDTEAEADETVIATLSFVGSPPAGVTLGASTVTYTILDDDTPTAVSVAPDWPLTPSGLSGGESFRLLFVSSTTRNASATDIGTYNSFVQTAAKAGHSAISDSVGDGFAAVASTSAVDARDNASTTGAGVPVYWLGGDKAADGYADFYDGSWDSYSARNESGATVGGTVRVWTGSNDDGTKHASDYLGNTNVQAGSVGTGSDPFTAVTLANSNGYRLYGLSPVFTVEAPPEISVELPISESENRSDAGEKKVAENEGGVGIGFPLSADQPLLAALTVCVRVTESGGDRVASGDEGIQTVNMPMDALTNGSGTHSLTWTNTAVDDRDSSVTVEVVAPNTASCSAVAGSYTVSSSDGSDKLLIQDDEDTTVELTSTDMTMTEGDASDTATLTVSLERRLYAGEIIAVPIALATSTGARLPGSTNSGTADHDFAVSESGTGVTLAADAPDATPRVIFTGHDTNTVQTATVTLTPVANRDDGDSTDETITATLTSLGATGLETTVSGGVTAHATNNAATLTLEDDEAAPPPATCPAQNGVFSKTAIRVLENGGVATYCVRLLTAPSGGNTTVAITNTGTYQGSATFSPSSLTFTATNYQTPQQVTVTGVDQPSLHLDRDTTLSHTASGGGVNASLGNVSVAVSDAPEVEAWDTSVWDHWVIDEGDLDNPDRSLRRPRLIQVDRDAVVHPYTLKATRGFRYFRQDFAPSTTLWYSLRLSNKPEPGGTVTVTVTSSDPSRFTLSQSRYGARQASLTVTFTEAAALKRTIWVHNARSRDQWTGGCSDITHTASGGGVRQTLIGTIRAHSIPLSGDGSGGCELVTGTAAAGDARFAPQNSPLPAQTPPAPTQQVANLSVTDSGGTSATASWDAVPHADRYSVSYSAESQDGATQTAGVFDDIAATSHTFDHGIAAPATVTVTVTPGYGSAAPDSGTGITAVTYLDSLAATATLNTGTTADESATAAEADTADNDGPVAPPPGCVSDDTLNLARRYYDLNKHRAPGYGRNWRRVLIAFGDLTDTQLTAFTAAEARQSETRWTGWRPFREALECIEQAQTDKPAPPPVEPEIAVTADNDVTEGGDARFTITASPAPAAGLDIAVNITQTGAFVSTGARTVTIGTAGSYTLTVATTDDSTDEPDGTVTATVDTGSGYTVSSSHGSATVAVSDDDVPEISIAAGTDVTEGGDAVFTITADPKPHTALTVAVTLTQTGDHGAATGSRTVTIPASGTYTLTVATTDDSTDEADGTVTATVSTGTGYTVSSSAGAATIAVADDDVPQISITAGDDITEGSDATFTITADPKPHTDLPVDVTVTQTGDHGATTGTQTVSIPAGGTYTLTVATVDDSTDEPEGSVTATVDTGSGYTVSSSSSASVTVSDNDDPPADDTTDSGTPDSGTPDSAPAPTGPLTLTVADASANEGDPHGLRFVATLSRASDREIKLGYGAFDITAAYNQDFTVPYRVFTISPGETEVEIVVPVVDDNAAESSETLRLYAYDSTFTAITGFAYATGTITDND